MQGSLFVIKIGRNDNGCMLGPTCEKNRSAKIERTKVTSQRPISVLTFLSTVSNITRHCSLLSLC